MGSCSGTNAGPSTQRGMTLLELLIVIALLSVVGFMALSQVGDDLSDVRYQDSDNRLLVLRRAIVGDDEPIYNGQRLLSGYTADNGRLPFEDWGLRNLIVADTSTNPLSPEPLDPYAAVSGQFDPEPGVGGYNDGGEDSVDVTGSSLFKGWRGPYLVTPPRERGAYRDGWGNQGAGTTPPDDRDALNFGWLADLADALEDTDLAITGLGRDGIDNATTGIVAETAYDEDITIDIAEHDWMVDVEDWEVLIRNSTDTDIALAPQRCLRASLLVYVNRPQSASDGHWRRLTSDCVAPPAGFSFSTPPDYAGSCLDAADEIDATSQSIFENGAVVIDDSADTTVPCPSYATVRFTAGGYASGTPSTLIPQGRHLLVLVLDEQVDDSGLSKHDTSGGPDQLCSSLVIADSNISADTCPGARTVKKVDFFPRAGLPDVTLEVAP